VSEGPAEPPRPRWTAALVLWSGSSFLGTICGVGGGIFATPILHYLVGIPFAAAIGTSLVLVFVMTVVATGLEATRADGAIDWAVVALLLAGSVPGAWFGYRFGRRRDARTLKAMFVVILLAAAARVWTLDEKAAPSIAAAGAALDAARSAWVVAIGFGGGFLAPLLGVGGGILVIPALFLTVPAMGYLEARACSMAMSLVNAAQSIALHWRGGTVNLRAAVPLTAIAVAGAVLGTWAVHLPGWAEVARIAMTFVLAFVAARFAWDLRGWGRRGG
jgi:uncharacterized membrane protein YfcA